VVAQYLGSFIPSFSVVAAPLHTIKMSGKSFQWINNQNKASNYFKRNSIQERVITLPNFHNPFELETYASGYAMEAVLMQGGRLIFYHSKVFHGAILNYRTYDKEICALVKDFKRWKKYLMGKDTIIHTDH
jgi:ectoine hydroxylase-related dioxygenase (phytanoyl-CoA dioxygenase family)